MATIRQRLMRGEETLNATVGRVSVATTLHRVRGGHFLTISLTSETDEADGRRYVREIDLSPNEFDALLGAIAPAHHPAGIQYNSSSGALGFIHPDTGTDGSTIFVARAAYPLGHFESTQKAITAIEARHRQWETGEE